MAFRIWFKGGGGAKILAGLTSSGVTVAHLNLNLKGEGQRCGK